jgi:hypothetical protein
MSSACQLASRINTDKIIVTPDGPEAAPKRHNPGNQTQNSQLDPFHLPP